MSYFLLDYALAGAMLRWGELAELCCPHCGGADVEPQSPWRAFCSTCGTAHHVPIWMQRLGSRFRLAVKRLRHGWVHSDEDTITGLCTTWPPMYGG